MFLKDFRVFFSSSIILNVYELLKWSDGQKSFMGFFAIFYKNIMNAYIKHNPKILILYSKRFYLPYFSNCLNGEIRLTNPFLWEFFCVISFPFDPNKQIKRLFLAFLLFHFRRLMAFSFWKLFKYLRIDNNKIVSLSLF